MEGSKARATRSAIPCPQSCGHAVGGVSGVTVVVVGGGAKMSQRFSTLSTMPPPSTIASLRAFVCYCMIAWRCCFRRIRCRCSLASDRPERPRCAPNSPCPSAAPSARPPTPTHARSPEGIHLGRHAPQERDAHRQRERLVQAALEAPLAQQHLAAAARDGVGDRLLQVVDGLAEPWGFLFLAVAGGVPRKKRGGGRTRKVFS